MLLTSDTAPSFSSGYGGMQIQNALTGVKMMVPLGQTRQNVASEGPAIYDGVSTPAFRLSNLEAGAKTRLGLSQGPHSKYATHLPFNKFRDEFTSLPQF